MRGTLMVAMALMALGRGAHAGVAVSPSLKLLAEERYDDDVLLRSAGGAGQFLTKLTSQLGAELKAPSLEASSWYAPDLLLHHGTGSVTVDHRAQLELEGTLGRRSSLRTGAQMWRVSDPTSLPRQGVARTASAVLYGKAELSLAEELSQRLQGRLGYRFARWLSFEVGGGFIPTEEDFTNGRKVDFMHGSADFLISPFTGRGG
ncbi:MAG: hypothetical protein HYZ28_15560, partial [Myxococcales bacterium]|nr:hypothetical protein [Myxococcales bacterium]